MKKLEIFDFNSFDLAKLSEPAIIKLTGGSGCGERTQKDPTAYPSGNGVLDGRFDSGDWKDTGCC